MKSEFSKEQLDGLKEIKTAMRNDGSDVFSCQEIKCKDCPFEDENDKEGLCHYTKIITKINRIMKKKCPKCGQEMKE